MHSANLIPLRIDAYNKAKYGITSEEKKKI